MSQFTDDVYAALKIVNPWEISRKYECPVIFFDTQHTHAFGTRDHRATVRFLRDGSWRKSKPIRVREGSSGLKESREQHLQAAIEWAEKHGLGVEEWVPTGFPNTWMPKDVKDRMKAELKAWRKQQATKESA